MTVLVSKYAGFCWGVRRAMDAAVEASARNAPGKCTQTLGPLVHNPQALEHLARRGVLLCEDLASLQDGVVIVRAHGVPLPDLRWLKSGQSEGRFRLYNATCPEVGRVQAHIKRFSARGYFVVILGAPDHPEVKAHCSFATSGHAVVSTLKDAQALEAKDLAKALVVAQTTFGWLEFKVITQWLQGRFPNLVVKSTICRETLDRQTSSAELTRRAEAVVVVGGMSSNNTRHLVDMAIHLGKPVQHVETADDLDLGKLVEHRKLAVLAGASTPNWIVEEVVEVLDEAMGKVNLRRSLDRYWSLIHATPALLCLFSEIVIYPILGWRVTWGAYLAAPLVLLSLGTWSHFLDPLGFGKMGPLREAFLNRNRRTLRTFASLTLGAGVLLAFGKGWGGPMLIAVIGCLTVSYPRTFAGFGPSHSLRAIPASKDLGLALTPVLLMLGIPMLNGFRAVRTNSLLAGSGVFGLLLAFHGVRHIHQIQQDRILGPETMVLAFGIRTTKTLAWIAACVGAGCLLTLWFRSGMIVNLLASQ